MLPEGEVSGLIVKLDDVVSQTFVQLPGEDESVRHVFDRRELRAPDDERINHPWLVCVLCRGRLSCEHNSSHLNLKCLTIIYRNYYLLSL